MNHKWIRQVINQSWRCLQGSPGCAVSANNLCQREDWLVGREISRAIMGGVIGEWFIRSILGGLWLLLIIIYKGGGEKGLSIKGNRKFNINVIWSQIHIQGSYFGLYTSSTFWLRIYKSWYTSDYLFNMLLLMFFSSQSIYHNLFQRTSWQYIYIRFFLLLQLHFFSFFLLFINTF